MRVLMTIDAIGGVWRYAMELAAALRPEGVTVIFAGLGPEPTPEQAREARRLGTLVWLEEPLDWMATNEGELHSLPRTLEQFAQRYGADLLHLNVASQASGLTLKLPVVVVSHSCIVTWWKAMRKGPLPETWHWLKGRNAEGFRRADAIIAPSRSHADLLVACYGPLPKLRVIPNTIASFPPSAAKQDFVFAAARWWDESKNARILDAAAKDAMLPAIMAGPTTGPNGQRVDIHFAQRLGEASHARVLEYMRRASVFVSPSLYEPFGLAPLEAARSCAALVLADIPVYRELWGGAAMFFDPRDPRSLCDVLNQLGDDPGLRFELGERAHSRSSRFVPALQAPLMASLYRRLAHANTRAATLPAEA